MQCLGGARSCCTCGNEDLNHPETHPFLNQSDDITAGCCICNRDTCNIAVYQEVTGAPIESLVYYSSVNDVYQPPFFVSFDDESEVILVTIRGTLSLEDMIVDMLAEGLSLSAGEMPPDVTVGDIQGYYVHMGILTSARNLRDIILRLQLIEKARLKRPSYPLVVCGHSLGAGVASVLALLLKKYYPEVKGYAFSPPLGLMSANIARYCKSFVVSVILGYDIVSRLSIPTLNDLKWRLLSALRDCKVPKYRLLSQAAGIVGLNCLLPSFCRSTNKSIGLYRGHLDETCQYHLLHPRVLDPRPPPAASTTTYPHSGSGALENCGHSIADASSGGDVTSSAPRPVRYLEEGRSLFRWLRIKTDVLLRTNSSAATCGLLASAVKIPEFSTTITSDSTDFSETSGFCGDLVSMDTNVRFAGLVVHIVEVQDEVTESGGIGVWDRPYERTGGHHPPSRGSHPPPVAIWTNSRQFQSILIHPRMLADHLPSEVTAALYRIFCATCKYQGQLQAESPNSSPLLPGDSVSLDGEALIRRLKKPLR
uniref:sn-1-specific diacylglycerol lipase n=2 Tax=Mesocestoides corti TaxID=53468 RepID=A0A5K3EMG5_MESCO